MPLTLTWKDATSLPVEAGCLHPSVLATRSRSKLKRLSVDVGNTSAALGDLFSMKGDLSDQHLIVEGNLSRVSRLGQTIDSGRLTIRGDAGALVASRQRGGLVEVFGSVGPGAGTEMTGGRLEIRGDAGDGLGSALPGSLLGMRDGVILVLGSAGADVGLAMRRGLIAVSGSVGPGAGRGMIAGSVVVGGPAGIGLGSGVKRGTIVLLDGSEDAILPTFAPSGPDRPPFLSLYLRQLESWGFPVPESARSALWNRFNGDLACGGQGEIWTPARA